MYNFNSLATLVQDMMGQQEVGQMVFDSPLTTYPHPHHFLYGWKSFIEIWRAWEDFAGSCLKVVAWLIQPIFAIYFNSRGANIIMCLHKQEKLGAGKAGNIIKYLVTLRIHSLN